MLGKSNKTTIITIRLPNEVVYTLRRRIDGRRSRWASIGDYLKERIIYDIERKHGGK